MNNLEQRDYYKSLIDQKILKIVRKFIPEDKRCYTINERGNINEVVIDKHVYGVINDFKVKSPTDENVRNIIQFYNRFTKSTISYDSIKILYTVKTVDGYSWSSVNTLKDFTSIMRFDLDKAVTESQEVENKKNEEINFYAKHKKDHNYNYISNGYQFLGWMNQWKTIELDRDGKPCRKTKKPVSSLGFDRKIYKDYFNCVNKKHRLITVQHDQRGTENTQSCPVCKIYWKYNSSD